MPNFEKNVLEKDKEQWLYEEREQFVRENYPEQKSHYEMVDLLNGGLDGMEVLERRDKSGDLEGFVSYIINQDREEIPYLSIGIMLTRKESEGEGIMKELFSEIKSLAEGGDCEYITAIADTEEGKEFLLDNGFNEEKDEVNGREHFRLDL